MENTTADGAVAGRRAQPFTMTPEWMILAPVTTQAKATYWALLAHVNGKRGDGVVWPGMKTIAEILGYNKRQTVQKYLRELSDLGAIDIETRKTKTGSRNFYTVHETPPANYAGPRSLAEFYAARRSLVGRGMSPVADNPLSAVGDDPLSAVGDQNHMKGTRGRESDEPFLHHADARCTVEVPDLSKDNPSLIGDICDYVEAVEGWDFRTEGMVDSMVDRGYEPLHVLNAALKSARTGK